MPSIDTHQMIHSHYSQASDVAAITKERDALIGEVQSLRRKISDLKAELETMREDNVSLAEMWCREVNR